jgi:hypothetical protein
LTHSSVPSRGGRSSGSRWPGASCGGRADWRR